MVNKTLIQRFKQWSAPGTRGAMYMGVIGALAFALVILFISAWIAGGLHTLW